MLTLKLPDGSRRQVPEGTRAREVAESIGKRLARDASGGPFAAAAHLQPSQAMDARSPSDEPRSRRNEASLLGDPFGRWLEVRGV